MLIGIVADSHDHCDAAREARRRFGKLEPVRRRCLHLQTGGHAMLHKLHLAFTCLLTVAIVGTGFLAHTRVRCWRRVHHADVKVVIAARDEDEDEGDDRLRLTLSDRYERLIREVASSCKRCVVVIQAVMNPP